MISLIQLLKEVEIQKNKWTPIPEDELDETELKFAPIRGALS